jgi:hypothetical protein
MDKDFQTSFIPKKPMIEKRANASQPMGLFSIVALFVLFSVLILTGGFYFYKGTLAKDLEKKKNDLALSKGRFEEAKISELQLLGKRLKASNDVLSKHISVSPIFSALQAITMKSVRYTKFDYTREEANGKFLVKLSGQSTGYRSIALQSDLFTEKAKYFIDPVFSNLTLDDKGNVNFELTFYVDPNLVNYKKNIVPQDLTSPAVVPADLEINNNNGL